jgi:two-component system LytT family response regulator
MEDLRKNSHQETRSRFLINHGGKMIPVEVKDIAYFFAEGRYTYLMTWNGKKYIVDHTLEELENMLNRSEFYRVNRSVLLHAHAVKQIHRDFSGRLRLVIDPDFKEEVYISKEKSTDFKKWMDK